jgi:hypothetical protein
VSNAAKPPAAPEGPERFAELDADFVRVIEDVIDVLILRNVIQITDFPPEVQAKLMTRKGLREGLARQSVPLLLDPGPNT